MLSFSTLSSMMERAVGKAVEHKFQQVLPTLMPAKSPRKATRKLRHIMEDSSSEEELGMIRGRTLPKRRSQTKTIKRARVLSSEEDSEGEQIPSKLGKKSTWLGSFEDESLSPITHPRIRRMVSFQRTGIIPPHWPLTVLTGCALLISIIGSWQRQPRPLIYPSLSQPHSRLLFHPEPRLIPRGPQNLLRSHFQRP